MAGRRHWGKGIATGAIEAIVKYAFENLDDKGIYATLFATTISPIKTLEKAGFIKVATIRNGVIKNNSMMNYYIYSVNCF